eukprot:TRINITY_DN2058_c0_g3_i2.p1 TRINITY_DN2058_c0_g3~~TRINITY_DN2058_c0_g3_i2.p1  ORF type:complete len:780 (+),score=284.65 TRINITY_DN2058_c0_g3_i2:266-2605(+)
MNRRESMTKKGALDMKEGVNVSGIGAQEAAKLETLFKLLSNGEDEIGLTELADLMPRLGCFHTEEELKTLFESVDIDGSGLINFMEFLQFMARYRESSQLALLEGGAECFRHLTAASKMKNVIRADDPLNWAGDILILASIIFYIVVALYEDARATDMGAVPNALKIFFAIVMVLDVLRGMFTSQEPKDTGCLPSDDRSAVRLRYLKSYRFVIDVIAALPIDMVLWVAGEETGMRVAQNVRMAKFFAFWTLFRLTPRDILSPTYARFYFVYVPMLKLAFWAVITTHCLAVIWIMLQEDAASDDAWAYLDSLYFVVYTLTTTGYGDIDVTTESQKIFSVFLFCCATLVTGVVVGKIVQVSQQADLKSDARTRMLETLAALNHLTIPNDFKEEVLAFQLHRLKHSNSLFNDAINGLPECMQDRMALYARMKIVRQVPIFAEATEICIAKLAQSLVNVFVPPEEFIVIAGEEGEEMFFLFHGMCGVSLANGKWVATIKRGGVFGEVALLESTRRSASIKSLTYCQLFRLDKLAFEAIVAKFPVLLESIKKVSVALQTRLNKPPVSPSSKKRASEDAEAKSTGSDAKGEAENAITAAPLNAPSMMKKERSRNRSMALSQKSANAGGEAEQRERARSNSRVQVESDEASSDSSASIGAVPTHVSDNSDESSDAGKDQDSAASTPSRRTRLNSILGDHAMAQVLKTKSMPPTGPPPPPRRPRLSFGKLKRMKNSTPEVELQARVDKICTVLGRMVYKDLVVPADGSPMAVPESPVPLPVPSDAPT